jgi:hypothetical protein
METTTLAVLSALMLVFELIAATGNALTIFTICHMPRLREMVMGELLLSLALSGDG